MTDATCGAGNARSFRNTWISVPLGSSWLYSFVIYTLTNSVIHSFRTMRYGLLTGLFAWISLGALSRTDFMMMIMLVWRHDVMLCMTSWWWLSLWRHDVILCMTSWWWLSCDVMMWYCVWRHDDDCRLTSWCDVVYDVMMMIIVWRHDVMLCMTAWWW